MAVKVNNTVLIEKLEKRIKNLEDISHEPQDFKKRCEEVEKSMNILFKWIKEMQTKLSQVSDRMGLE